MSENAPRMNASAATPKYVFRGAPRPCIQADYAAARDEFVGRISKEPGVISIYQIGTVGAPGISDLDFVVVLDEKTGHDAGNLSIANLSEKTRYILFHEQFFVNEAAIKNLHRITSVFDISHVYGEEFEIGRPEGPEAESYKLLLLNDICVLSLSYEYHNYVKSRALNLRLLLARLNSLKYPVRMLSALADRKFPEFDGFITGVEQMRQNWFDTVNPGENGLVPYLKDAAKVARKLVGLIREYNREKGIFDYSTDNAEGYFDGEGKKIRFRDSPGPDGAPADAVLDTVFGLHLKEYAGLPGLISNHINSHLFLPKLYRIKDETYQRAQRERMSLLNDLAGFRESIKLPFGGIFTFGYGMKAPSLLSRIYALLVGRFRS